DGYGGTVISSSLAERAYVEMTPAGEIELDVCGSAARIGGPQDLALDGSDADVARAVFTAFPRAVTERAFRLKAWTEIPFAAGLSGSTAMVAAVLGATLRLLDIPLGRHATAEMTRHIEFHIMNCVCGFQDQYMAVFGGLSYMEFRDK